MDPRDLDTNGLLREILLELQSIRQLLEPTIVESKVEIAAPEPVREVKKWRYALEPWKADVSAFFRANPNVHEVLNQFQEMASGRTIVTYRGYHIEGAEEVS